MKHFTKAWFPFDDLANKYLLEIKVDNYSRIFNRLDPAPFFKRDLNIEVADYIIDGLRQLPSKSAFFLDFHLDSLEKDVKLEEKTKLSIHNFFNYKLNYESFKLKHLIKNSMWGFCIALPLIALASFLSIEYSREPKMWEITLLNGATVAGWVALWTPVSNLLFTFSERLSDVRLYKRIINSEIRFFYDTSHQ